MQTRDSTNMDPSEEGKRDLELENIVGNMLITEYQVDRFRTRLSNLVNGYRPQMMKNNNTSTHIHTYSNTITNGIN
jgi:hypothetical protein